MIKKSEQNRVDKSVMQITNTSYVEGTKAHADGVIQRGVMEENEKQLELIKFFLKN